MLIAWKGCWTELRHRRSVCSPLAILSLPALYLRLSLHLFLSRAPSLPGSLLSSRRSPLKGWYRLNYWYIAEQQVTSHLHAKSTMKEICVRKSSMQWLLLSVFYNTNTSFHLKLNAWYLSHFIDKFLAIDGVCNNAVYTPTATGRKKNPQSSVKLFLQFLWRRGHDWHDIFRLSAPLSCYLDISRTVWGMNIKFFDSIYQHRETKWLDFGVSRSKVNYWIRFWNTGISLVIAI